MRLGAIRRDTGSLNCCLYDEGVRVRTASFKASALGSVCLTQKCNRTDCRSTKVVFVLWPVLLHCLHFVKSTTSNIMTFRSVLLHRIRMRPRA